MSQSLHSSDRTIAEPKLSQKSRPNSRHKVVSNRTKSESLIKLIARKRFRESMAMNIGKDIEKLRARVDRRLRIFYKDAILLAKSDQTIKVPLDSLLVELCSEPSLSDIIGQELGGQEPNQVVVEDIDELKDRVVYAFRGLKRVINFGIKERPDLERFVKHFQKSDIWKDLTYDDQSGDDLSATDGSEGKVSPMAVGSPVGDSPSQSHIEEVSEEMSDN